MIWYLEALKKYAEFQRTCAVKQVLGNYLLSKVDWVYDQ